MILANIGNNKIQNEKRVGEIRKIIKKTLHKAKKQESIKTTENKFLNMMETRGQKKKLPKRNRRKEEDYSISVEESEESSSEEEITEKAEKLPKRNRRPIRQTAIKSYKTKTPKSPRTPIYTKPTTTKKKREGLGNLCKEPLELDLNIYTENLKKNHIEAPKISLSELARKQDSMRMLDPLELERYVWRRRLQCDNTLYEVDLQFGYTNFIYGFTPDEVVEYENYIQRGKGKILPVGTVQEVDSKKINQMIKSVQRKFPNEEYDVIADWLKDYNYDVQALTNVSFNYKMEQRKPYLTHGFAVVVCRNIYGKWLAVKETMGRGWWLPAGGIQAGETFEETAYRETLEEAGIEIEIKGILRVEHSLCGNNTSRMRVVFFAMPIHPEQQPKNYADSESELATWITLKELQILSIQEPLRGPELMEWGTYIENGGLIAPLSFLVKEDTGLPGILGGTHGEEKTTRVVRVEPPQVYTPGDFARAIEKGDLGVVRKCLLNGMDPNLSVVVTKDWTALQYGIRNGQLGVVVALLLGGGDLKMVTKKGRNGLHFAAQASAQLMGAILLSLNNSVDIQRLNIINHQDFMGETPLHFAMKTPGQTTVSEMLIASGADTSIKDNNGFTPLNRLQP